MLVATGGCGGGSEFRSISWRALYMEHRVQLAKDLLEVELEWQLGHPYTGGGGGGTGAVGADCNSASAPGDWRRLELQ